MDEKKWFKSKELYALVALIFTTVGAVVSGETSWTAAIPALVLEVATVIIRLFFTKAKLVT